MARILVTGSTDGLGRATAATLLAQGHNVVVHARSRERLAAVADLIAQGAELVIADLADQRAVTAASAELEDGPPLDAVIHNAGVLSGPSILPVNVVAPFIMTALLTHPRRHVYLSSGMHQHGSPRLDGVDWTGSSTSSSYSDSKLFLTALSAAVAARRRNVLANAVNPGWVPTKMGGSGAPDDFDLGFRTQLRLATDPDATTSGAYWFHERQQTPHTAVGNQRFQEQLIDALSEATGAELPPPDRTVGPTADQAESLI